MSRERIGNGWEHEVYVSKREGWVLKRPTRMNAVSMLVLGYGSEKMVKEINQARSEIRESSRISIPETRVIRFPLLRLGTRFFGRSYIVAQRFINEDHSVADISEVVQEGQNTMSGRYQTAPDNFRTNGGIVHLIDPSHAFYRFGERLGFSYEQLVAIRSRLPLIDRVKGLLPQNKKR